MFGNTLVSPWTSPLDGVSPFVPPFLRTPRKPGSPGTFMDLGGSPFHVQTFETRRPTDAPSAPPRTVGWTGLLLDSNAPAMNAEFGAVQVCLEGKRPVVTSEAARDKVVLCDHGGPLLVYQADRERRAASLCACGNASAAAAAMLAQALGLHQVERKLTLPEGTVRMTAAVESQDGHRLVTQRWGEVRFRAHSTQLAGWQTAICTGTLNDYVIVRLASARDVEAFTLEQTQELWHEAGHSFGFQDILRCRLAAVSPEGVVRFFTCGRSHPSAPLTGLSVLALAAREIDWLAPLLDIGQVQHRRGMDALPMVHGSGDPAQVELPAVTVTLGPG